MSRTLTMFVHAAIDDRVEMAVHPTPPDDEAISIIFGPGEHLTLDFFDVASLERLHGVVTEAITRLRAMIDANAQVTVSELPRGGAR